MLYSLIQTACKCLLHSFDYWLWLVTLSLAINETLKWLSSTYLPYTLARKLESLDRHCSNKPEIVTVKEKTRSHTQPPPSPNTPPSLSLSLTHTLTHTHTHTHTHTRTYAHTFMWWMMEKRKVPVFFNALRPQRPLGLLGTGSPGRPPRLSHRCLALSRTESFSVALRPQRPDY